MDIAVVDGTFIRMAGPAHGRTLLFVHAMADCGLAFTPLFATPLAETFRLIAVDLSGFGASPRQDQVLTVSQHAEAIVTLVRSLASSGPVGLVGHSVGSMIAVEAASHLGERFDGLFSIEGNLTAEDAYFSGRAADFDDPYLFKQRFLDDVWNMAQAETILRRFHGMATLADAVAMWNLGRDARRLSIGDAPGQAYLRVRPSLYYWSPHSTVERTQGWIAAAGMAHQQFADASHWPTVDQPAATARAIQAFFGSA
jgi:pimeloyl-ACP methyl ester carboxylesterase